MDELYRDQILEHYKRPHNFGRIEDPDLEFEDTNPLCGDEQHVTIRLDEEGKVAEVAFDGKGCAISTAATSLLTDELDRQDPRGGPPPAERVRPRAARDRHLGDADEVRDARPQGRSRAPASASPPTGRTRARPATPQRRPPTSRTLSAAELEARPALDISPLSAITAKLAPCGSVRIAKRPAGMSIGSTMTPPPAPLACSTAASVSSTPK